ncbi:hypothetical protein BV898_13404 [Hypsibius exemplaris]|uniref:Intradiol ring-cleavage dioxygenases domain-containing protein n=1 Tax=Hypsibius exemplaris TaxID=2072580 RepID=A0A1W0WAU5_HYPEX|nr:hypothetical protein BV898_13404 [Hypsibius exemplaris]
MLSLIYISFLCTWSSSTAFARAAAQPNLLKSLGSTTDSKRQLLQTSCKVTSKDIEGPFYKRNAPIQQITPALVPQVCKNNVANDRLILNGTIRQISDGNPCGKPTRAVLDVWQANADGEYSDHSALSTDFACRTRLVTNHDGIFTFSSIFPGRYDDGGFRPAHIHFQITPLDLNDRAIGKTLTTQMYFAQDHFLKPHDSCAMCSSDDPTLITHVSHQTDIKTFVGTWDVLLSSDDAN